MNTEKVISRLHRPALTLCAVYLLLSSALLGLDPTKSVFQFNCQSWTRQNGLPADNINSIVQTSDGFIWLATQQGLVRFDGLDFTAVPIALPEAKGQHVRTLHSSRMGGLWFSIAHGGFGHYDGRQFTAIADERWSSPGIDANTILEASNGSIWTGTVRGLGRWSKQDPSATIFEDVTQSVLLLREDAAGRIWVGTAEKGLSYVENGQRVEIRDDELLKLNIQSLARTSNGEIWVGTNRGVRRYNSRLELEAVLLPDLTINALLIDRRGVLWVGTGGQGLGRFHEAEFQFLRKADGLGSDNIKCLLEDAEGSIWAGTEGGMSQLTDLKLPMFTTAEGISGGGAQTVTASKKGGLWIAAAGGVSYFDGKTSTNINDPALLPNQYSRRSFEDSQGNLYIGDGDKNIDVIADGKLVKRYTVDVWPEAFAEDAEGVLVGVGMNLFRIVDGELRPFVFTGETPFFNWINNISIGKEGVIWVASHNGLFRLEDGGFKRWSTDDGLMENRIHYVFEDIDGAVWAGLPTELIRLKNGKLTQINAQHGLHDNRIYAIVPDDHGFFWIASGRGYFRVARQNLNDFADGKIKNVTCDIYDGLESVKFADRADQGYSGCKTSDGRIWFPTPRGVVMIDPQNLLINQVAPPVNIQFARADEAELNTQGAAVLSVGTKRVEFNFSALSYISPSKVRVQFRLEGYEPAWIEAGAKRSVTYDNLPPGAYIFRVQAANADGAWNTTGDSFTFQLPPPFYRTLWFYAVCGLAVGGSLFGGVRWKVRHLQVQQDRLRSQNDLLEAKVAHRTDELANSLSLLKATLDSTADGILAVQFAANVVSYNRQFAEMWRLPAEMVGKIDHKQLRAYAGTLVKNPEAYAQRITEIFSQPEVETFDVIELKDGRFFERYCKPQRVDGVSVGVVINFRDITERRRAEETIAEASALMEALLANTLDVIYFKDRHSRFVRYSQAILPFYGQTERDSLIGKNDFDLIPESRAQALYAEEQEIIRTGNPVVDKLERHDNAEGKPAWVMTTKIPWRDIHGSIIGLFGIARDVTALKDAEDRLARERDLLRSLMDSSPDQIYFKDRESRFIRCSQAMALNFGLPSTDPLIGKTDFDFFAADHAQDAFNDEQELMRTGEPLIGKIEKETWNDGRIGWALTSKMPLRDKSGAIVGTVGISKDIGPLKQAEEKLAQVNKQLLETSRQAGMAEVATSVLHNVGNVLNSVNVSATLVLEQVRESKTAFMPKISALLQAHAADLGSFLTTDPRGQKLPAYLAKLGEELLEEQHTMAEELEHLRKNIEHIKEIVAMQQSFAKVSGVAETLALTDLVDDALRINASALSRHQVELVREYEFKPTLSIDRHKLMQILVNLIRNSKYACDDRGGTDKKIVIRITRREQRVRIAIIDNGIGIPTENLTRIFAHGFTTRKDGHGFGLHSGALVAKELGGSLIAESDGHNRGATFTIELPLDPKLTSS